MLSCTYNKPQKGGQTSSSKLIYEEIDSLNAVAWEQRNVRPDQLPGYSKEALFLSDSLNYIKGKAYALRLVTSHLVATSQFDSAVRQANIVINLFESLNDTLGQASTLNLQGLSYNGLGDFDKSRNVFSRTLQLYKNLKDLDGQSRAMNNIAITFFYNDDYVNALKWYFECLKIREQLPDKGTLAIAKSNIGMVYRRLAKSDLAIKYYTEALDLVRDLKDKVAEMTVLGSLGTIYYDQYDLVKSLECHQEALRIALEIGDRQREALAYTNLGAVEQENGNLENALQYYNRNLAILEDIGGKTNKIVALMNMAEVYRLQKKWGQAIKVSQKMLEIGQANQSENEILQAYQSFAETYKGMEDFKKAFHYSSKYHALKDSIFNKDKIAITEELSAKYESEKKAAEIALKEKELAELKHSQEARNLYVLLVIFVLVALVGIGSVYYLRQRDKFKKERSIAQKNRELAELSLKNEQSKKDLLKSELDYKSRELINLTNFVLEKESANKEIEEKLMAVLKKSNSSMSKDELSDILLSIKKSLKINEGHHELIHHLQQLNAEFYGKLDEKIPGLTMNEKRLCALLRLNLTSKQIAVILNIATESVDMKRYRLRKKIGIESDTLLSEFVNTI
ncbi:tetratricopeptide repeat protein [Cytophagales bacterium LB-30]|uniref:Tetratricopeptide repeat protein n=1 Tax=Shiella aurantiaca TaxID=3058365 RepID=A0ABT8F7L6_9BACT|nr:tetratricopeptide repeat protein [Shiella aurantiaca]MDN4166388.1 tetratricopeptide repeat protein [Shiella aurantiaca]